MLMGEEFLTAQASQNPAGSRVLHTHKPFTPCVVDRTGKLGPSLPSVPVGGSAVLPLCSLQFPRERRPEAGPIDAQSGRLSTRQHVSQDPGMERAQRSVSGDSGLGRTRP